MVKKSEFIWNTIASITTSALSAVLLLIVTRTNGTDVAGMFSITFATATILNAIGEFNMRIYQVTDTKRMFSFYDYLNARIVTSVIMVVTALLFCVFNRYDTNKALLCMLLVGYRFVEDISDIYQGELQANGRLDLGSQSIFIRTIGAIAIFCIVNFATKNILLATFSMIFFGILIFLLFDLKKIKPFMKTKWGWNKNQSRRLIVACFPSFFSVLINLYIINAPKYAIDSILKYHDQTVFNILFLPTFTINLMSLFALKPILLSLGIMWNDGRIAEFNAIILKLSGLIGMLTLLIEVVCYYIGIPILEFIYGINLSGYRPDLLILIVSGGLSALSVMFSYALTTMRYLKIGVIPYVLSAICAVCICYPLVNTFQIRGASWSSVFITLTLAVNSGVILRYKLSIHKKIERQCE